MKSFTGILLASGSSERFGGDMPKQFSTLSNKVSVLEMSFRALMPFAGHIVITLPANFEVSDDIYKVQASIEFLGKKNNIKVDFVEGGNTRLQSMRNAFKAIQSEYVFIHDAARPLVHAEDIEAVLETAKNSRAALLAKPATDTIKKVVNGNVIETLERNKLYTAETPQAFETGLLYNALGSVDTKVWDYTDDASLVEAIGISPRIVISKHPNPKVTHKYDLSIVHALMENSSAPHISFDKA